MQSRSFADAETIEHPADLRPPLPHATIRRPLIWDGIGIVLWLALTGWTYLAEVSSGGDAAPVGLLLVTSAGAFVAARALPRWLAFLAPLAVMGVAAFVVMSSPTAVLRRSPFEVPFGYAHFTWAFFTQAAIAGLMLASMRGPVIARALVGLAALALATIPFGTIVAGPLVFLAILGVALIAGRPPWSRVVVVACGLVLGLAIVTTGILGARYDGLERHGSVRDLLHATSNACAGDECSPAGLEGVERVLYRAVAERRVALWHDALVLMGNEPLSGVGPGRFGEESPIASVEQDEPWAHHEFLQQGAETGLPGLVLLILLFAWGFGRLAAMRRPDAVAVLGAVGLLLLGLHACFDFVLHHPAAPVAAAALLGFAASERQRSAFG